jgi:hypothetical protein
MTMFLKLCQLVVYMGQRVVYPPDSVSPIQADGPVRADVLRVCRRYKLYGGYHDRNSYRIA